MALYSYLSFKSAHDSLDLDKYVVDGIESGFACPIAWRALFRSDRFETFYRVIHDHGGKNNPCRT